ncbi:MAG TPA: AarF/UbiB family protein [Thermomicrobiaceae bacterium]|nr:AarF/UbiB family protein [Thermomicrobiaceae bacterium]
MGESLPVRRRSYRQLRRYRQIADVLARHGLGFLIDLFGLERFLPQYRGFLGREPRARAYTRPEHLRLALEELGPTFIKLGQILSTRRDLLPPAYQAELAKLQDAAAPIAFATIRETVEGELGRPLEALFASFEEAPLAAASIGQAHAARLRDGTEVVVKVRRPAAVEQIEVDLAILLNLATVASRRSQLAEQYDLVALVEEFAATLRAELDYEREAHNAEHVAANFANVPGLRVPRVYWELTSQRVLTLQRIRGIKISNVAALEEAGVDRAALANDAARMVLKMALEDGFFHADLHPGNLFVEPSGRIGLIDFGMVGTLDETTRDHLIDLLIAVVSQDTDRMVDELLELGAARRVDRVVLRRDLQRIVSHYINRALGEIEIGAVIEDALGIIRRHRLQLPANLALLLRMLVMAEGLGQMLDPRFEALPVARPFGKRLLLQRYSPARWARRMGQATFDAAELGTELPRQVRRLIHEIERGDLQIGVRPEGFDHLLRRVERLTNRLILGLIVAALINGLAALLALSRPFSGGWSSAAFALGSALTLLLVILLVWSVLRSLGE